MKRFKPGALLSILALCLSVGASAQTKTVAVPETKVTFLSAVDLKVEDAAKFGGETGQPVGTKRAYSFADETNLVFGLVLAMESNTEGIQFSPEMLQLIGTFLVEGMAKDNGGVRPDVISRTTGKFGSNPALKMNLEAQNSQANLAYDVFLIGEGKAGVALVIAHLPDLESSVAQAKRMVESLRYGTEGESKWEEAKKPE